MGLFFGSVILFTILKIKETKSIIKESKNSKLSIYEIAEERADDDIEVEKMKIIKSMKMEGFVYNRATQTISNIFRTIWLILLVLISLFWFISTI